MSAVHYMCASASDFSYTLCGLAAIEIKSPGVYEGWGGKEIIAKYRAWDGVTCKRCLKNPHAPGNRFHRIEAQLTQETKP